MTPKEKAEELLSKYYFKVQTLAKQKQCALIAVDEILDFMEKDDKDSKTCYWANHPILSYWYKVKQEIENL